MTWALSVFLYPSLSLLFGQLGKATFASLGEKLVDDKSTAFCILAWVGLMGPAGCGSLGPRGAGMGPLCSVSVSL